MSSECYCVLLRKASRKVSSLYDGALKPLGINVAQFSLLRNIRRAEPISLTDLASRLELDRSTVGRNVRVLEKRKLVVLVPGEDQRETLLRLTDVAHRLLEQGAPLWEATQQRMEAAMGADLLQGLRRLTGE